RTRLLSTAQATLQMETAGRRKMDPDNAQAQRIRRAHDVIDGCILSLPIADSAKRALQRELEALYEAAIYPLVLSADENRSSRQMSGGVSASSADSLGPLDSGKRIS